MSNIYLIRNGNFPEAQIECIEQLPEVISNSVVWEIDPDIFPLKGMPEISAYFQNLADNPEHTKILPGFKEHKYN